MGLLYTVSVAAEQPIIFESQSGDSVGAFEGELWVAENRLDPKSRKIPLRYVRFAATGENPGPPIVYLAGGPGGSGIDTAKWRRFPLFMAMREFGDVIALDQRGTGQSNILPDCESNLSFPATQAYSDAEFARLYRQAFADCLGFWAKQGVDVRGYNTVQSVADLDDLREHLNADKLVLWGTSYGSHLALAALQTMEDRIDRLVLSSIEGLTQTIKMPARTDAYFVRLQQAINTRDELKQQMPDASGLIRRVHDKLLAKPVGLTLTDQQGGTVDFLLQRKDMQRLASAMISDPGRAWQLLQLYQALDADVTEPVAQILSRFYTAGEKITFAPMGVLMDVASGIDPDRKALVYQQAAAALLGAYLNPTLFLDGVAPELDLGQGFRQEPVSRVPALILSGTLDGRTYLDSQREAVKGLANRVEVTVHNAGHNLFMASPEVTTTIQAFMRGDALFSAELSVPLELSH
ncbi:alpha/beta hydrolase [Bowmanella dokdonensis]|uniref:Alpha/beta hydrolase n=2 Tax=Bowmanella dokdonensis TaxID=751969 RepID=A0A939IMI9_9ALTE|nr:alpha/beta hydrolase [Bowmanella dokdonensis]